MKQQGRLQPLLAWLPSLGLDRTRSWRLVLLLAVLNGLLYFLFIPPWWHYDEPGHFEYAWLAANLDHWPKPREHDEAMRREMAQSMERYGWYARRNYTPDFSSSQPVWIGATQTGGKPAYYFAVSLALRLARGADITLQYNIARLVSLLLYLLIVLVVWKAMGELVSEGHPLQWIVSGFVALLPAFADAMVAVSDDVGAVLVSSVFLWLSIRMIRRGFSIAQLLPWTLTLVLCYFTKNTAWFTFVIAPFVLVLSLLRSRRVGLVWGIVPVLIVIAGILVLETGGAAAWYQDRTQGRALRLKARKAVLGEYAFQLDYSGGRHLSQTGQFVSEDIIRQLRGKTVTLGAWVWANQRAWVQWPVIRFATEDRGFVDPIKTHAQARLFPVFHQTVVEVPEDAIYAIVSPPYIDLKGRKIVLFFDGVVLIEGAYTSGSPQFNDPLGKQGIWNGQAFSNLIDNGSAEQGALRVRSSIDQRTRGFLSRLGSLSAIFSITGNWRGAGWYYRGALETMLRTFWASVAADKFNLPGNAANNLLLALTLIGLLGSVRLLWRKRAVLRWDLVFVLLAAFLLAWSFTAVRGVYTLLSGNPTFPWARYAFPAILPSALLICAGWMEWLGLVRAKFNLSEEAIGLAPIALMAVLSLYTLFNVVRFFHPSLANKEWLFWLGAVLVLISPLLLWRAQRLTVALRYK